MVAPWYVMAYVKLERIAWRHGYALALHGSMARDLDIIAVPWTEDADDPEKLLAAFKRFIVEKANVKLKGKEIPTQKPHGRQAYALPIGYEGHYLDVSIMPRLKVKGSKNGRPYR
jgi:hypothetical protein